MNRHRVPACALVVVLASLLPVAASDLDSLQSEVDSSISLAEDYDQEGITPQQIQEVKGLLELSFPATDAGAALKARVYVELSRIYHRQGISPMAIKALQDGIADLSGHRDAELSLREELLWLYRSLGFAPQAIREHKRIARLRSGR